MTTGKSVRVPDELHARLAARVDTHGSIAAQVTRAVAEALEHDDEPEVLVVEVPVPAARARAATTRVANPRGETVRVAQRARPSAVECLHPITRRIGTGCGACGADPVVVARARR